MSPCRLLQMAVYLQSTIYLNFHNFKSLIYLTVAVPLGAARTRHFFKTNRKCLKHRFILKYK